MVPWGGSLSGHVTLTGITSVLTLHICDWKGLGLELEVYFALVWGLALFQETSKSVPMSVCSPQASRTVSVSVQPPWATALPLLRFSPRPRNSALELPTSSLQ